MQRQFDYENLGISVEVEEPSDLVWLTENLSPAFEVNSAAATFFSIQCRCNRQLFDSLHRQSQRQKLRAINLFSMDGQAASYPAWEAVDGSLRLLDSELACIYIIDLTSRSILISVSEPRHSVRIAMLRLIREIASQKVLENDALHQHAAAASVEGAGILVCGPRRAGKTTLLSHLLERGANYIANDRSVISQRARQGPILSGMPTIVSVRANTITLIDGLGCARQQGWLARETVEETVADRVTTYAQPDDANLSLSPAQYCRLMERPQIKSAPLKYLLFPKVDTTTSGILVSKLNTEEVMERVTANHLDLSRTVFSAPGRAHRCSALADELRARLAPRCQAYSVVLGTNAKNQLRNLDFLWSPHAGL